MNVLFVLSDTSKNGGATKAFMALLRGIIAKGIYAIVVVPDKGGIYEDLINIGVEVISLLYRPNTWTYRKTLSEKMLFIPRQLTRLYVNKMAVSKLKQVLIDREINIVHTNVSVINIGAKAAEQLSIPHVYHFREYVNKDFNLCYFPSFRKFYSEVHTSKSYSICITKDNQRHHKLFENDRSRVIYDGVMKYSENMDNNVRGDYFLYAGRIEPTKGLITLLHSYLSYVNKVSNPLKLNIAGNSIDNKYYNEILYFISTNKLGSNVCFLGALDELKETYANARALIVPSKFEGFGLCMPEAMFEGCIVIGRNTGGTKEQFDNGLKLNGEEIGYRFNSEKELSERLCYLHYISNEELQHKRNIAFYTVNKLYSIKENVAQTINFYKEILSERYN